MKKIITLLMLTLLLIPLVYSIDLNEIQWDGKGTQTLTFWERLKGSIGLISGATIPSGCESKAHTTWVFDASGRTSLDSIGNRCSSGDYMALFNCGLSSKYSSSSQCNYGRSIREGDNPIKNIVLSSTNRYMYFCYSCAGQITIPTPTPTPTDTSPCVYSGVSITQGTNKCIGKDKITCNIGKTLKIESGVCKECLYNGVSYENTKKICVGNYPYSEYAWECTITDWKKTLCLAGCENGICKSGVCYNGQFQNEICSDSKTLKYEECINNKWESKIKTCDENKECKDGQCLTKGISPSGEKICCYSEPIDTTTLSSTTNWILVIMEKLHLIDKTKPIQPIIYPEETYTIYDKAIGCPKGTNLVSIESCNVKNLTAIGDTTFDSSKIKIISKCYKCINNKPEIKIFEGNECLEEYQLSPIDKCEGNTPIIEEPKQPSLTWAEWQEASPAMRIKTTCSTKDNCAKYEDLSGKDITYKVDCKQTAQIIEQLEQDSKSICKSGFLTKLGVEASITGGTLCAMSVISTVLSGGTLAPITITICGATIWSSVNTLFGCAIWAQPDLSKGACIAIPKSDGNGEKTDFCFDWVKSIGTSLGAKNNACTVGWIALVIGFVIVMILISKLGK